MTLPETLTLALDARADGRRHVNYIAGEEQKSRASFGELRATALAVLRHFQDFGMGAGDQLIIFTGSNEQFIDGFWACLYGGIVPVPVAVGISDDHRLKLLKIFRQLERPWVYTDKGQLARLIAGLRERGLLDAQPLGRPRGLPPGEAIESLLEDASGRLYARSRSFLGRRGAEGAWDSLTNRARRTKTALRSCWICFAVYVPVHIAPAAAVKLTRIWVAILSGVQKIVKRGVRGRSKRLSTF